LALEARCLGAGQGSASLLALGCGPGQGVGDSSGAAGAGDAGLDGRDVLAGAAQALEVALGLAAGLGEVVLEAGLGARGRAGEGASGDGGGEDGDDGGELELHDGEA